VLRNWWDKVAHFLGEDLGYFAASLSFYTVFSIIPLFWVLFFVLSKFDAFAMYYSGIKDFLVANFVPTHTEAVTAYLDGFLENSKKMGAWGLLYVAVASLLFYQNFQYVLNKIFMVPNHSLAHALGTYFILALLMPMTLGGSFFLSDLVHRMAGDDGGTGGIYSLISYFMIWLLFFVVYKVAPNMNISYRVVLLVSLVVSLLWVLAKMAFVYYVLVNQTYTSLYGSFSVLLFLLLWIYLSWFMLLHGMRMCYLLECHLHH
jgi:membrane protein